MKRRLVVGNWKMHGQLARNQHCFADIKKQCAQISSELTIGLCVPFPYLAQAQAAFAGSNVMLGAQDVSVHIEHGPYTGEVSAAMLRDFGVSYTLVGHSERRTLRGESADEIAQKALAAIDQGLMPIVCIGETAEQRHQGQMQATIHQQLRPLLQVLTKAQWTQCILAYEPVWSIGTGRVAGSAQIAEVFEVIAHIVAEVTDFPVPKLYGGSVKPDTVGPLFTETQCDGVLVGGASLVPQDFGLICRAAVN